MVEGKRGRNWEKEDEVEPLCFSFLPPPFLSFGTLPSFRIIKSFRMSEEVEAEEQREIEVALNSISQPSELPALISRRRTCGEGRFNDRETNNEDKRSIHLRPAASAETNGAALNKTSPLCFGHQPETQEIIPSKEKRHENEDA